MHLLTLGDVIPDTDFLGQKGYTLRMVYTYCSIVPKKSTCVYRWKLCVQNMI